VSATAQPPVQPDERVFRAHVAGGAFQAGADRGRWWLERIEWPHALFSVAAAPRAEAPSDYGFRFLLDNYPASAPVGRCWDIERDTPLEYGRRPWGTGRVEMAFRTNFKDDTCLYLPCDRLALEGHDAWRSQHPSMIWTSSSDITLYLRILHDLLRSRDYTGVRGA
jgi:hypothetical protein